MLQIYISGQLVDVFGDEEVVLTKSINNIGDIQSRDGDKTNTFELPLTNRNKLIFESAQVLNSGTTIPYDRLPAIVKVNGLIHTVGWAELISSGDTFTVAIVGGNADWYKLIGDKSLRDLDLEAFNHLWTGTNVRDARLNNVLWSDVYNYPNVDYGLFATATTIYWSNFYPGVYVKYLLYKIFQEVGFTMVGDFYDNNDLFQEMFLPFCADFKRDRVYSNRNAGEWDTPSSSPDGIATWSVVLTNTISSTDYNILNDATGILTILDAVDLTFRIKIRINNTDAFDHTFGFYMTYTDQNGDVQTEALVFGQNVVAGNSYTYEQTLTRTMGQTTIVFEWQMSGVLGNALDILEFEIIDYTVTDEEDDSYLGITETFNYVTLASTLPDIKQTDLILTVCNQFGLMFTTDHQTNRINFFNFNDVVGNIPNAKDWSNKLDISEKPKISYKGNYAQTNKFTYVTDTENQYLVDNPEYGNGEITIDNTNLEVEKTSFESVFSLCIRQNDTANGTVRMAYIPKFIEGDEVDCESYIGLIRFETTHLLTMDGYALEATQPAIHGQDLSFASNLLDTYYPTFRDTIQNYKQVQALLHLHSADIVNLDQSIPIWIDYFSAYFYINEVKQFKLTSVESTIVDLIRIG